MKRLIPAALCLCLALPAFADNWPQWRGPKNDGISTEKNIPTEWGEGKNLAWTLPLPGRAGSTPCVWGDKIFLTSTVDSSDDLIAMSVSTAGKELWRKTLGKGKINARGEEGDGASSSPSTDGKHVWFFFGSGDLACLDMDGNSVWAINTQKKYGKFDIQFGMHSTPVLFQGKLYLQLLHTKGQHVVCLDAATGDEVWKIDRKSDGKAESLHSYASPFIWTDGKDALLVTHGNDYAMGHSLKDGSEVWRVGDLNGHDMRYRNDWRFVASPLCTPDLIVVPTCKNGALVGINPHGHGTIDSESKDTIWRNKQGTPDVPCPLLIDGLLYISGENGEISCLDPKTGKTIYSEKLKRVRHRASPVYADGKIYLTNREGTVFVLKAGPKFELLATNTMKEDQTASPAIADGRIYLRGFKNLYAVGTK
jgi:outer membrane protein assembly factor BamB